MPLHFVDDNGSGEVFQGQHRLLQSSEIYRVLQVEVVLRARGDDGAGQCGLADLACAYEEDHWGAAQGAVERSFCVGALLHDAMLPGKSARVMRICQVGV
ncbi:hypothetical protein GCM10010467_03130 [Actinocorallia glomerata]|uniref:Uncharacterized protein n=2 Tax=Actinomycetes TaxID=1760 RepID=A0ABP6LTT1_9MICC